MHRNNSSHTVAAALLGVLLLAALQLIPHAPDVLRFERSAFDRGVLWPLLTSQLVHLSLAHAALNALALLLSLGVWSRWISLRYQLTGLAGGALGVALLLVFDTDASYYAGLSGALHGLWAGNAIMLMAPPRPDTGEESAHDARPLAATRLHGVNRQCVVALILAALVIKLWLQGGDSPERLSGWLHVPLYHPAHWAGLVGGMLVTSGLLLFRCLTLPRQ
jgi:membrane associated rhomboid family serine protease